MINGFKMPVIVHDCRDPEQHLYCFSHEDGVLKLGYGDLGWLVHFCPICGAATKSGEQHE